MPKLSCVLSFTQKRDTGPGRAGSLSSFISMQKSRKYMYIYTIEFSIACNYKLKIFLYTYFLEMQTKKRFKRYFAVSFNGHSKVKSPEIFSCLLGWPNNDSS